jgi:hypothetical protein
VTRPGEGDQPAKGTQNSNAAAAAAGAAAQKRPLRDDVTWRGVVFGCPGPGHGLCYALYKAAVLRRQDLLVAALYALIMVSLLGKAVWVGRSSGTPEALRRQLRDVELVKTVCVGVLAAVQGLVCAAAEYSSTVPGLQGRRLTVYQNLIVRLVVWRGTVLSSGPVLQLLFCLAGISLGGVYRSTIYQVAQGYSSNLPLYLMYIHGVQPLLCRLRVFDMFFNVIMSLAVSHPVFTTPSLTHWSAMQRGALYGCCAAWQMCFAWRLEANLQRRYFADLYDSTRT